MHRLSTEQKQFIETNTDITYSALRKKYQDKYERVLSKSLISYYRNKGLSISERRKRRERLSLLGIHGAEQSKIYEQKKMYEYIANLKNTNNLSKKISNYIRRYLLITHKHSCEECGWSKKNPRTNRVPLEIHHKDGDFENNNLINLQLLCPNCHSLTYTYRANINGRSARKKLRMVAMRISDSRGLNPRSAR